MRMRSPRRPGTMVGNIIDELEITVTDAAKALGVSRQALNNLINNEQTSVSPEMAVRLEAVFGSSADNWLRIQANYDAAKVRKRAPEIQASLQRMQPSLA